VDRCALFVDAGYMLADGAMAVHGTRHRDSVSWDYSGLLKFLSGLSRDRSGLPMLRCYWYEATVGGRRTSEHDTLADLPGLKLRLGRMRPGRREGVETEMHRDLTTLARNGAINDAILVSGEEDLVEVVAEVQDLGIRVILVHITVDGNWSISRPLRQECDDIMEIGGAHLRPFVDLIVGAEPARRDEEYPAGAYSGRSLANGHGSAAGAVTRHGLPAAALPAAPAIYAAPVVNDFQRAAQPLPAARPAPQQEQRADGQSPQGQSPQGQPGGVPGQAANLPGEPGSARPSQHDGPPPGGPPPGGLPQSQQGAVEGQAADLPGQPRSTRQGQSGGSQGQSGGVQGQAGVQPGQPAGGPGQAGVQPGQPAGGPGQAGGPQPSQPGGHHAQADGAQQGQAGGLRNQAGGLQNAAGGGLPGQPGGLYAQADGIPGQADGLRGPAAGDVQQGQPNAVPRPGGSASFAIPNPLAAPTGPGPGSQAPQHGADQASRSHGGQAYPPDPFLDRIPAPGTDGGPAQEAGQPGGSHRHGLGGGARQYPPQDRYPAAEQYQAAEKYPVGEQYPAAEQYPAGEQYPPASGGQYGGSAVQLPPGQFSGPQHAQHGGGALGPSFGAAQGGPYSGPQPAAAQPPGPQPVAISLADAVQTAHAEGFGFGEAVARDAPALWLEAVLARKPRMPSDLEARLLQGSALPIDSLLHDEVRHALRRGFWDALERSRR